MKRPAVWAWLAVVLLAAVFGRPALDFGQVVVARAAEALSMRFGGALWRPRQSAVVDRATAQGEEIAAYLRGLQSEGLSAATRGQLDFGSEAAYVKSQDAVRQRLMADLRYPPPGFDRVPNPVPVVETLLGSDDIGTYRELRIDVLPGVHAVGVYITPKAAPPDGGRFPLVIAAAGRQPAPPIAADGTTGQVGRSNRDTAYGALKRGFAVWSPTYVFYGDKKSDDYREQLTVGAWQAGTSLPAIEIAKTVRALDVLLRRPEIDPGRVAMVGMSYGGFNTFFTTAIDTRIRAAVAAAYFNDREAVLRQSQPFGYLDWRFPNSLAQWQDPAVIALICPRPLLIQSGNQDGLFPIEGARRTVPLAAAAYERLGIGSRFRFSEFVGRHEFNGEEAWNFLQEVFKGPGP